MKRNGKEIAEQGSNSFKSSSECFPLFLTTGTRFAAEAAEAARGRALKAFKRKKMASSSIFFDAFFPSQKEVKNKFAVNLKNAF